MKTFVFVLILACILPVLAFPHSGGLDANGGHYNRKTGEYHYHRKKVTPTASQSRSTPSTPYRAPAPINTLVAEQQKSSISPTIREARINEYFRQANENVGALSCDLVIHTRDVPESVKEFIKRRDGSRCVICDSTIKLEVDHKRALENGGDNSVANLATLCDDCHTSKTRMDNSLRRKREKSCHR